MLRKLVLGTAFALGGFTTSFGFMVSAYAATSDCNRVMVCTSVVPVPPPGTGMICNCPCFDGGCTPNSNCTPCTTASCLMQDGSTGSGCVCQGSIQAPCKTCLKATSGGAITAMNCIPVSCLPIDCELDMDQQSATAWCWCF